MYILSNIMLYVIYGLYFLLDKVPLPLLFKNFLTIGLLYAHKCKLLQLHVCIKLEFITYCVGIGSPVKNYDHDHFLNFDQY